MAAIQGVVDEPMQAGWSTQEEQAMGPGGNLQPANGASLPADDRNPGQDPENPDYSRGDSVGDVSVSANKGDSYREKQRKPNKVYIGGLPEHTREEDLQSCFGKIGNIINIELKVGYGFVEFDSQDAAEESVAKYHEGFFMGNKIRVEISHGGGRTAKYAGDPGACFKCGQMGHWARECPNQPGPVPPRRQHFDPPLIDRIQRDYHPPPRALPPRDEFPTSSRYPARDTRYEYAPPPPSRDIRRPPSPRTYRDYRDYEDYRRGPHIAQDRDRYAPAAAADVRGRYAPPPDPAYRGYGGPPPAAPYDRYDRRPNERYTPAYPPAPPGAPVARARTPPRVRDDFDRIPAARDYHEYRGRPVSPPPARYPAAEYSSRMSVEPPVPRYRRRSESPPRGGQYESYTGNGYAASQVAAPPSLGPLTRGNARDYAPTRSARDPVESGYRRA